MDSWVVVEYGREVCVAEVSASISKIVLLQPLCVMPSYPASVRKFTITSIRML